MGTTKRTAQDIKVAFLASTLDELVGRFNACPSKSNLNRVLAVRAELSELRADKVASL